MHKMTPILIFCTVYVNVYTYILISSKTVVHANMHPVELSWRFIACQVESSTAEVMSPSTPPG